MNQLQIIMKKTIYLAMMLATVMISTSVSAQSLKDKKAAKQEAWQMEQQQKREEAELRHQYTMDSLRNAQKMQDAAIHSQETEELIPCTGPEFYSTREIVRGNGIGESMQQQTARRMAYSNAVKDLAGKISTTVKSVFNTYVNDETINMDETFYQKYEGMQKEIVNQTTGYRTICEKYASYINSANRKIYKCYLAIEIGTDEILKPLYETTQQESSEKLNVEYEQFKEEFNKIFEQNGNL